MHMRMFLPDTEEVASALRNFARTVRDKTEKEFYSNVANRINSAGDVTEGFNSLVASFDGGNNK